MATEAQCKKALDLYEDQLSQLENVVGLGIVPADESLEGSGTRDLAVAVYVKKKVSPRQLAPGEAVPPVLEVPRRGGTVNVPTRVIEQGEVTLEPLKE